MMDTEVSIFHQDDNMQDLNDIFVFDPNYAYNITLYGGSVLRGFVIEVYPNGIVLSDLTHIPTDSILYFNPIIENKNETPGDFTV